MNKLKTCSVCQTNQIIFSKGRCKFCSLVSYNYKKKPTKPIKKQTEKNKLKRKCERQGFGEFFTQNVEYIRKNNLICENCGILLSGNIGEVAHIISKSRHKEVAINPSNRVFLCCQFTCNTNFCHEKFDNGLSQRPNMEVFNVALERYNHFRSDIKKHSKESLQFEGFI